MISNKLNRISETWIKCNTKVQQLRRYQSIQMVIGCVKLSKLGIIRNFWLICGWINGSWSSDEGNLYNLGIHILTLHIITNYEWSPLHLCKKSMKRSCLHNVLWCFSSNIKHTQLSSGVIVNNRDDSSEFLKI